MSILNSVLKLFIGDKTKKDLKKITLLLRKLIIITEKLKKISNDKLRNKTVDFKNLISNSRFEIDKEINELNHLANQTNDINEKEDLYDQIDEKENEANKITNEILDNILPEAFAVVKETATRFLNNSKIKVTASENDILLSHKFDYIQIDDNNALWSNKWDAGRKEIVWDMIHYDVQLIGGIVLHQGKIAEMQTGEGKTLVATLPVYLNALTGKGVHLVTVNDYLAKRDSAWMAPIFQFHGFSIDCIDYYKPNSSERKQAYEADITYGTNNEFGFDYLRDNMAHNKDDLVQKKHNYAIVDEVDSVLVDDARTPLIISGPTPLGDRHEYDQLKPKISSLVNNQKTLMNKVLADAKAYIKSGDNENGGLFLLRVFRGSLKIKH